MRTGYGAFGEEPTQPPPFPQPPLPQWDDATSDIPTTEDVGFVFTGKGPMAPPTGPAASSLLPAASSSPKAGPGLPSWVWAAALAAGLAGALMFGGRR
jgi:hypothetical protein